VPWRAESRYIVRLHPSATTETRQPASTIFMTDIGHYVKREFLINMLKCPKFGNRKPVFSRLRTSLYGLRPDKSSRQAWRPMSSAAKNKLPPGSHYRSDNRWRWVPAPCHMPETHQLAERLHAATVFVLYPKATNA
jgi:hypothetical protein